MRQVGWLPAAYQAGRPRHQSPQYLTVLRSVLDVGKVRGRYRSPLQDSDQGEMGMYVEMEVGVVMVMMLIVKLSGDVYCSK